jgi:uncharacterized membrane protein YkvA (DUF1232 family)
MTPMFALFRPSHKMGARCRLLTPFRHPRTPWYAKTLAIAIAAYVLSPIDLIPDFIPVLGLLDEAILLPLAIAGVLN